MGIAASFHEQSVERQREIYREMVKIYDEEYLPKVKAGEARPGVAMFRCKFEELMGSDEKLATTDAKPSSKCESKMVDEELDLQYSYCDSKNDIDSSPKVSNKVDVESDSIRSHVGHSHGPVISQPDSLFMIGDVVKAKLGYMMFEGVVVGNGDSDTLDIDFGDEVEQVSRVDCSLVISGLEFEVGDIVSACPLGSSLYFNGTIVEINMNGTFDVLFEGDDDDDIERNIHPESIRKLRTGRQLVVSRWQKAKNLISATRAFGAPGALSSKS